MPVIFFSILAFILVRYCYRFLVNRSRKAAYMKAGKKWEHIVEELSKRK